MREIKSTCYQRSFTSRYMKIVLLKVDLNLSRCEGFNFIFFFPVNVWKGIAFSFSLFWAFNARNSRCWTKLLNNRGLNASNNRRKRACIICRSLGGEPVELCYEPDIYGIQQIDSVDEETLLLFTSKTDKACLRDLFDSHCFMGEAEKQVHDFCFT